MSERLPILGGTLDLIVMKALREAGCLHGFGIMNFLSRATDGAFDFDDPPIYQSLRRLEELGWVEGQWAARSETGRRAKLFRLTGAGEEALRREEDRWRAFVAAVAQLEPSPDA